MDQRQEVEESRLWLPSVAGGRFDPALHPNLVRGSGITVEFDDGTKAVDANSGMWHLSLGYAPPAIVGPASDALGRIGGSSLLRRTHGGVAPLLDRLTGLLVQLDPVFFFATSGSEGVDVALRVALRHGAATGRDTIAHIARSYHGVSMGPLTVTDSPHYRGQGPAPFRTITLGAPSGDGDDDLDATFSEVGHRLAAVIVEPIQCVGGVVPLPQSYLGRLASHTRDSGCLLIADEVSTGTFRTGPFIGCDDSPLAPDIVILAKGLTAGMSPMSVVAVRGSVAAGVRSDPGYRVGGTTQAGDPVGCAAATATLEYCDSDFGRAERAASAAHLSSALASLRELPGVRDVRGRGHLWGVEVEEDTASTSPFVTRASAAGLAAGVLLHPLGTNVIPVVPPLNSKPGDIDLLVGKLTRALVHIIPPGARPVSG